MISAMDNALSAIAAAGKRIETSTNNIANQDTTRSLGDGAEAVQPFLPQDIVQISRAGGGVEVAARTQNNPTQKLYDPSNPDADDKGVVNSPNVNVADEMVEIKMATYDFKAALKVIKVQDEVQQSLLDITA